MSYMRITWFNTLYKRETSCNVFGDINFGMNGGAFGATFKSGGRGYFVHAEYIIKIEHVEVDN